jgi:hypothetical protein
MTTRRVPWLRITLVRWLLDDNEPLAGDLVEECAQRSRTWFCRQLIFAVLTRTAADAAAALRDPARLLGLLGSLGMFIVLCFQVVVAGSLLARVLPLPRLDRPEWLNLVALLSFLFAWVLGQVINRVRERSRPATILLCGAGAAVAALLTHSLLSPTAAVFFPGMGHQAAAATVFVVGLLAGATD